MRFDTLLGMTSLFVVLGSAFSLIESAWPERGRRSKLFSRERLVDWVYWPFSAFVTGNFTRVLTLGAVGVIAFVLGHREALTQISLTTTRWGIGEFPVLAQLAIAIAIGDLVNYWNHRLRHTRYFWPFHAIHHSPRELDWLSSVRMHPVDDAIDNVLVGLVVLALGTRFDVWLATGPFLFFFNVWLHANVRWRFGWFERVIATPVFHRAHHSEGSHSPNNFAGVFPLWDALFGTLHLPADPIASFGPGDTPISNGLLGQLVMPFVQVVRLARAALSSTHGDPSRSER